MRGPTLSNRTISFGAAMIALVGLALGACGDDDSVAPTKAGGASATAAKTTGAPSAASSAAPSGPSATVAGADPAVLQALANGQAYGSVTAKVTLTAFVDFQCPFCLLYTKTIEPTILKEYVATGKVRYEVRMFPILGAESKSAALAARCAAGQNRFWPFHDMLFQIESDAGQDKGEKLNVGRFSDAVLKKVAAQAGVDGPKYDACIAGPDVVQQVADDIRTGTTGGVTGTPGLLLNGQLVPTPGNAATTRKMLDDALAK